jgi:AcrR family transcriptional regulator
MSNLGAAPRRRRADARRSAAAVLAAAVDLFGRRPEAGLDEVAAAAAVSRQTVYAHYASREALIAAVVEHLTAESAAVLDALDVTSGTAVEALQRWAEAAWSVIDRYPVLLALPMDADHAPVIRSLEKLIERGLAAGELDRRLPASWLVTAVLSLGHAAGAEVIAGRLSAQDAGRLFVTSVTKLAAAGAQPRTRPRSAAPKD